MGPQPQLAPARALAGGAFADSRSTNDMDQVRLRLAGAVRVNDDVSSDLAEARDHLAVGRVRASGCVAGVVRERGLKAPCLARSVLVRDPTTAVHNEALKAAGAYPKETWRQIQLLGDLRNRCARADREPTAKEGRRLVAGVDEVLRALPS